MRKRRIVAATNTMAKCSWFVKVPSVMCAGCTKFTRRGEGKKRQVFVYIEQSGMLGNRIVCELFLRDSAHL